MLSGIFSSTSLPALEQVAKFSQRRHEVLAGNVANIDTPGYRVRDLSVRDFENALAQAIEDQVDGDTAGSMVAGRRVSDPFEATQHAMDTLVFHDDSDVNLERQVTEIAKNQQMHSMAIAIMRSQFGTLNAAISERV